MNSQWQPDGVFVVDSDVVVRKGPGWTTSTPVADFIIQHDLRLVVEKADDPTMVDAKLTKGRERGLRGRGRLEGRVERR